MRIPSQPSWTNRIHADDAAAAIVHLPFLDDPAPVHIGVDDEPADLADVIRWLASRLGVAPPPTIEGSGPRGAGKLASNDRLRATGWTPAHPTFREGYASVLGTN